MKRIQASCILLWAVMLWLHCGMVLCQPAGAPGPAFSPSTDAPFPAPILAPGSFPAPILAPGLPPGFAPESKFAPAPSSDDGGVGGPPSPPPEAPPSAPIAAPEEAEKDNSGGGSKGISSGSKAGIAVGVIFVAVLGAGGGYVYVTRKNNQKRAAGRMRF